MITQTFILQPPYTEEEIKLLNGFVFDCPAEVCETGKASVNNAGNLICTCRQLKWNDKPVVLSAADGMRLAAIMAASLEKRAAVPPPYVRRIYYLKYQLSMVLAAYHHLKGVVRNQIDADFHNIDRARTVLNEKDPE